MVALGLFGPIARPVVIVDYDPAWSATFALLRDHIAAVLGHATPLVSIEHVGSTAVPGLAAKPIIDIDVVVPSPPAVSGAVAALGRAGTGIKAISASPAARRSGCRRTRPRLTTPTSAHGAARPCAIICCCAITWFCILTPQRGMASSNETWRPGTRTTATLPDRQGAVCG